MSNVFGSGNSSRYGTGIRPTTARVDIRNKSQRESKFPVNLARLNSKFEQEVKPETRFKPEDDFLEFEQEVKPETRFKPKASNIFGRPQTPTSGRKQFLEVEREVKPETRHIPEDDFLGSHSSYLQSKQEKLIATQERQFLEVEREVKPKASNIFGRPQTPTSGRKQFLEVEREVKPETRFKPEDDFLGSHSSYLQSKQEKLIATQERQFNKVESSKMKRNIFLPPENDEEYEKPASGWSRKDGKSKNHPKKKEVSEKGENSSHYSEENGGRKDSRFIESENSSHYSEEKGGINESEVESKIEGEDSVKELFKREVEIVQKTSSMQMGANSFIRTADKFESIPSFLQGAGKFFKSEEMESLKQTISQVEQNYSSKNYQEAIKYWDIVINMIEAKAMGGKNNSVDARVATCQTVEIHLRMKELEINIARQLEEMNKQMDAEMEAIFASFPDYQGQLEFTEGFIKKERGTNEEGQLYVSALQARTKNLRQDAEKTEERELKEMREIEAQRDNNLLTLLQKQGEVLLLQQKFGEKAKLLQKKIESIEKHEEDQKSALQEEFKTAKERLAIMEASLKKIEGFTMNLTKHVEENLQGNNLGKNKENIETTLEGIANTRETRNLLKKIHNDISKHRIYLTQVEGHLAQIIEQKKKEIKQGLMQKCIINDEEEIREKLTYSPLKRTPAWPQQYTMNNYYFEELTREEFLALSNEKSDLQLDKLKKTQRFELDLSKTNLSEEEKNSLMRNYDKVQTFIRNKEEIERAQVVRIRYCNDIEESILVKGNYLGIKGTGEEDYYIEVSKSRALNLLLKKEGLTFVVPEGAKKLEQEVKANRNNDGWGEGYKKNQEKIFIRLNDTNFSEEQRQDLIREKEVANQNLLGTLQQLNKPELTVIHGNYAYLNTKEVPTETRITIGNYSKIITKSGRNTDGEEYYVINLQQLRLAGITDEQLNDIFPKVDKLQARYNEYEIKQREINQNSGKIFPER